MQAGQPRKTVRIGGACAFVGDSILGPRQLVGVAGMQYLVFDHLAEMTLSGFAHARKDDPSLGYAVEFVELTLREILPACQQRGIRLVANGGGLNPASCARAVQELQRQLGTSLKVSYIEGDDCLAHVPRLRAAGTPDFYSGAPVPDEVVSANVYLGALPIARALALGADIVITGRIVDSAATLGILMHEFGWDPDDHDALATGSLAGHVLECGTHATGGIHTDWREIPDWENIGYPYIDCAGADGFVVRKPAGTGGRVTRGTVSEQILYEIGDPARYVLPDVVCDFTGVTVTESGPDEVTVRGARGRPPSESYKLSASYRDGFRCVAQIPVFGVDAVDKARRNASALLGRARAMVRAQGLADFGKVSSTVIGAEDGYGPHAAAYPLREAVARVAVTHGEPLALDIFSREARIPGVSFAPGTTTGTALAQHGRPAIEPVYGLYTCLVPKRDLPAPTVWLADGSAQAVPVPLGEPLDDRAEPHQLPAGEAGLSGGGQPDPATGRRVPLIRLAYGRSGDKGNSSNIAIIARRPEYVPLLESALTPSAVRAHLGHLVRGAVTRYPVPGLHAFNFLLQDSLDGGAPASLRLDPMGKGMAQQLLEFQIPVPAGFEL